MLMSHQGDHDGWNIFSFCREANPADWSPGKPIIYALRGHADFARAHEFPPGYTSTARIDLPESGETYFFDFNKGHEHVRSELKAAITKLKKPTIG